MKAHVLGFFWEFTGGYGEGVSMDDLLKQLRSIHNTEFEFGGYQRLVYAATSGDYIIGLLLTAKNHKKFCELRRKGKSLKINVRQAEEGASLIDFNFFLIDKTTSRGLYQYYHNSCNARVFTRLCDEQLGKVAAKKVADEIAAKGGTAKLSDDEHDKIRAKYDGDIICHMHVRREKFAEIVKQLKGIATCDFTLATIEPEHTRWHRILSGVSRIVRHHVSFQRKATVKERANAIIELVNSGEANDAAVHGVDADGLDQVISIANNPDSFGNWPYDDLAADMTFEAEDFEKSKFIATLIALADEHKEDFLRKKAK